MDDSRLTNINQLKRFLKSSKKLVIKFESLEEKYAFIDKTIDRFGYINLTRKDKRIVLSYIKKFTGYRKAQLFRLVARAILGKLKRKEYVRENPNKLYTVRDIKLLEETDEHHRRLSSVATKEILRREYEVFRRNRYENISGISSSHINNLRNSVSYKSNWVNPTKAREVGIGKTQKPENNDIPGSIRVDSVHQRDIFHINCVDEITQWEIVVCVPRLTRKYLKGALKLLLKQFPFNVFNFHSDRGSEFINETVAAILNELLINQTKSRSRHCNDNALVESKNGSVIRKNMGYTFISKKLTPLLNEYFVKYFNVYVNYHRPSLFVTEIKVDKKGREKKIYGEAKVPYDKLRQVSWRKKKNFLKKGLTFKKLDIIAYECSDNDFAKLLREKERILFDKIADAKNN
jgi:hypothetical protein